MMGARFHSLQNPAALRDPTQHVAGQHVAGRDKRADNG